MSDTAWHHYAFYFVDMKMQTWATCGTEPTEATAFAATNAIDFEPVNPGDYTFQLDDVELDTDSGDPHPDPGAARLLAGHL